MSSLQKSDLERVLAKFPERTVKSYLCRYCNKATAYDSPDHIDWKALTGLTVEFDGRFLRWNAKASEHINANKVRVYAKTDHAGFLRKKKAS